MNSMVAQVYSLPTLIRESLPKFDENIRQTLDHQLCLSLKRVFLTGCGDSHHAALNTELAFEYLSGLPTEPMTAMQFARYGAAYIPASGPMTNAVIGTSVSGEVARTLEALLMARQAGATTISLTANAGGISGDLSGLFDGNSGSWLFSPSVNLPIFTAGRIAGSVREAEAVQQQALISYQQTIQNAFREVDDALTNRAQTAKQLAAQKNQVDSLRQYAGIARMRYDNGYTDFLTVLDAERSLFNAELSYTQTQGELHLALINLYKAMGGGWIEGAEQVAQPKVKP